MYFSNLALASVALLAAPGFILASEDAPVVPQEISSTVEVPLTDGDEPLHNFPIVFTIELDEVVELDPETMEDIQSALVMSANEVHDPEDMKFYGLFVNDVIIEKFDNKKKEQDTMMMRGPQADFDSSFEDDSFVSLRYDGVPDDSSDEPNLGWHYCWYSSYCSRTYSMFGSRLDYRAAIPNTCRLCLGGAENVSDAGTEDKLSLYKRKGGAGLVGRWQKRFCQRLRNIRKLKSAHKCFIAMDTEHEDPIQSADSYLSTFMLEDHKTEGVTLINH